MKDLVNQNKESETLSKSKRIFKKRKIVRSLAVKHDYESFYTGGEILLTDECLMASLYDDKIRLYDGTYNKVVLTIEHENEEICNFEYLSNKTGEYLLSFTKNGIIRMLKLIKEEGVYSYKELRNKKLIKFTAMEMKIDKSKNFLVCVDAKGSFKILKLKEFIVIREFNLGMGYVRMRLVNQYVIFLSKERKIAFYNIMTNNIVRSVESQDRTAFSEFVVINGVKKSLLIAGFDHKLYLNESEGLMKEAFQLQSFVHTMESLKLPNEDKTLIVVGYDTGLCELLLYDGQDNSVTSCGSFLKQNQHAIGKILFDFKNQFFYLITDESEIFKMKLRKVNKQFNLATMEEITGLNDEIMEVKFIDKNNLIVCSNTETIRHIDIVNNKTTFINGHEDLVTACDVFNTEKMITGSKEGKIILWNIQLNEQGMAQLNIEKRYKAHVGGIVCLSMSPKTGNLFISAGADGFIKLWDLIKNSCRSLKTQAKELNFAKISPNEQLFMYGSHDKTISLHNIKDLSSLCKIDAHKRGVWDAEFAPMEKKIASCSSDMIIKIWDYTNPSAVELEKTLEGHSSAVLKVKWMLYGLQLISGSSEGVIKVWNVRKETCLSSYNINTGRIWALDLYEDSDCFNVISGDNDNKLILWTDNTEELISNEIGFKQDQLALREELRLLWDSNKFLEAVKLSFEKGLNESFFNSLNSLYVSLNAGSKIIYLSDEMKNQRTGSCTEEFKELIYPTLQDIWKQDKTKLLKMVRSFITNRRFLLVVELVLQVLLRIVKVRSLNELKDELRENEIDIGNLLHIYQVFNQRHLNSTVRDLKAVCCMDFKVRQHLDMLS